MPGKTGRGRNNRSFVHIPDYNVPLTIHQNFTLLGNRHPILQIQPFSQSSHLILCQLFLLITPIGTSPPQNAERPYTRAALPLSVHPSLTLPSFSSPPCTQWQTPPPSAATVVLNYAVVVAEFALATPASRSGSTSPEMGSGTPTPIVAAPATSAIGTATPPPVACCVCADWWITRPRMFAFSERSRRVVRKTNLGSYAEAVTMGR